MNMKVKINYLKKKLCFRTKSKPFVKTNYFSAPLNISLSNSHGHGDNYCYKHVTSKIHDNTNDLVAKIAQLEQCIKDISAQIHSHEQEIIILNKNSPNTSDFKCEVCCYAQRLF